METTYMTKEDVETAIDSGNQEVINNYMSGGITIGEAPVEAEPEVEAIPTIEEVEEIPERVVPQDEIDAMRKKYEDQLEDQKRLASKRESDIRESYTKEAPKTEEVPPAVNEVSIEEDDDDAALAGVYARNNRKLIESLKNGAGDNDEIKALKEQIERLVSADEIRASEAKAVAAANVAKDRQSNLFTEVDDFVKGHEHFKTGKTTQETFGEVVSFKSRLSEFIKSDKQSEIDKAYHLVVNGDDQKLAKGLEAAGIKIPEGAENYLKLTEIVDLKNGFQFNKYTGEYEEIKNDNGNRVVQRSVEDAYRLSRFPDIMKDARKEEATKIQEQLTRRGNSANLLSDSDLTDPSTEAMSTEQNMEILNLPNSAFQKNPALKQKLDMIISGAI